MKRSYVIFTACLSMLMLLINATPALAHAGHGDSSFAQGFWHPIHGMDHLLAMLAVGLLSARVKPRQWWALPAAFVVMMAVGGLAGLLFTTGGGVTAIEWGIGLSVLVFGLVAAAAPSIPVVAGAVMVGAFAICHGHAHVAEMGDAAAMAYFPGMLLCTTLLHLSGLALGLGLVRFVGNWSLQAAGALVAVIFAVSMFMPM